MSVDSKKTILLEKKYLYVRASLGFQLEGTSTEIIPTNNGFYRFYIDNLSKALGNSYVNILYDSNDLSFQSFCSDLYMDELMSSDSSAIEDVVLELQNNTKKIGEFESGVSSALEAIHQDNVAITAKIEGFESGVSSAMLANHEDNVALSTQIDGSSLSLRSLLYSLKFPSFTSLTFAQLIPFTSNFIDYLNTSHIYSGAQGTSAITEWDSSSLIINFTQFGYGFDNNQDVFVGFKFNYKFPSNLSWYNLRYNTVSGDDTIILYNGDTLQRINKFLSISTGKTFCRLSFELPLDYKSINHFILQLSMCTQTLQRLFSLCGFSFPSSDWIISPVSNEMGNISCVLRKYRSFIPVDLGYHYLSSSYKGWVDFCILDCDEIDLDFIKKSDIYFTFNDGNVTSKHLYECSPYLSNNKTIFFTNLPSYQSPSTTSKLCGINLVYTGVSSAS